MAKRKPLRTYKYGTTGYTQGLLLQPYRAATVLHPTTIEAKGSVAKAHLKHQGDIALQEPRRFCLAEGFNALPAELRAHIFSFLLVQPVKWNLDHDRYCPLYSTPTADVRPRRHHYACATSIHSTSLRRWRILTSGRGASDRDHDHDDLNPWRSEYAPEVTNCFMESDDWDAEWRVKVTGLPFPRLNKDMPCLCARRENLDVMLVCRQWYREASQVLWGSNTFAFETCEMFADFATTCTARDKVTRISILQIGRNHNRPSWEEFEWPDWTYHKKRQALIAALRNLPSLTHIELDSCLLRDVRDVKAMLRLGMKQVRSVRFIYHERRKERNATNSAPTVAAALNSSRKKTHRIYPSLENAVLLRGGLPEEVARAIKGQHRGWTKHQDVTATAAARRKTDLPRKRREGLTVSLVQTAVQKHVVFEDSIRTRATMPSDRVFDCDDPDFWECLWWKTDGRLHWSQSYLGVGQRARDEEVFEVEVMMNGNKVKKAMRWEEVFPFAEMEL